MIKIFQICLLFFAMLASSSPAFAAPLDDYKAGVTAYQNKNYRLAASCLQRATDAGYSSTAAWMYLGHAYTGLGERANAIKAYQGLISNFKGTPEAAQAYAYAIRLDPNAMKSVSTQVGAAASAAQSARPTATAQVPYRDRIIIVPPTKNHPPVSSSLVAAVRGALGRLPRNVYDILNNSGATVNLAPNIEDKWPGSGDGDKPNSPGATLGEEGGRTYGRDIYLYERKKLKGSDELSEARSTDQVLSTLYHEIGHAVDDSLNVYSKDKQVQEIFRQDWSNFPAHLKSEYNYFSDPAEACAEIVGSMIGKTDHAVLAENMPRLRNWLKTRLRI